MTDAPLLFKRKYRWTLQLFKDGKPVSEETFVKISSRPAMPWTGHEVIVCDHDMVITMFPKKTDPLLNFEGTVPKIKMYDGCGNLMDEWDLLGLKKYKYSDEWPDYSDDEYTTYEIALFYEDVKYTKHMEMACLTNAFATTTSMISPPNPNTLSAISNVGTPSIQLGSPPASQS